MNLDQREWRKLLNVVEQLNTCLEHKEFRQNAGRSLLDLLQADHFASYVWDCEAQQFTDPVFLNMSNQNLARYEEYYQFNDPITPKMQGFRRAVSVNEVMDQKALIKTEFFNDFLSVDRLYYGINVYVFDKSDQNIGDFRIWRSEGRDNFSTRDLEILDMVAPHFRNAMRNIAYLKGLPSLSNIDVIRRTLSDKFGLTKREQQVAATILQGFSDKKMADKLCISRATLRTHIQHIYTKLGVNSRAELSSKVLFSPPEE